jgi:1-acyl-sn-glycerol-3-phosphate acyltransferase
VPRPLDPRNPSASRVYRVVAWVAFTVMRLQRWRVEVRGLEHVPRVGGAVLATNHTSFWDFFTAGRAPYLGWGRPVRILAKESLFRAPVFGRIMRAAQHIPVHRGAGADALRSAVAALERGELVLVLPEQTISPSFELLPYKTGAARMAAAAGAPVVPAVSWGSHRFHTTGRRPRWSWRLPVLVAYGEPLCPAPDDDPVEVTAELQRRSAALLTELQASYPDGHPAGAWWVPARLGGSAPTVAEAEAHLERLTARWKRAAAARVEQAREAIHGGTEQLREGAEHAREVLSEQAGHAREVLSEQAGHAREVLSDQAEHVREGAGHAREVLSEQVDHVRDVVTHHRAGEQPAPDATVPAEGPGRSADPEAAEGSADPPPPGARAG